ncbi:Hypothetical predicted protein [Mytilus galloprovincialis]|uniref:Uncharacterized protein n=1 Tax=Mytilus galloprovincialis TaxID=29158 RepID=A0A8B6CKB2_MYTGA|nr:Hypothetical predicted protein [Mytilus galloprovincialis]
MERMDNSRLKSLRAGNRVCSVVEKSNNSKDKLISIAKSTSTSDVKKVADQEVASISTSKAAEEENDIFTMEKKQYDTTALKYAYDAVQNEMSVYKAAKENWGIPESILRGRTLGLVSVDGRCIIYLFDEGIENKWWTTLHIWPVLVMVIPEKM